uniref:HTH_Tnp_Tc3_1 domain-containing protein n=1 Tax=Steinernema glaseri TaxID=37863 RepID=A0A1I7ZH05_9BILA
MLRLALRRRQFKLTNDTIMRRYRDIAPGPREKLRCSSRCRASPHKLKCKIVNEENWVARELLLWRGSSLERSSSKSSCSGTATFLSSTERCDQSSANCDVYIFAAPNV